MAEDLHRLVYYSRNRIVGSADELSAAIGAILVSARRNNTRLGVTGALLFNGGAFGQVLEAPREAIEEVFERIRSDTRHDDVTLLSFAPVPKRSFSRWAMAFAGTSIEDAARFGSIAGETGYHPPRMTGDELFRCLHSLVVEEERAA